MSDTEVTKKRKRATVADQELEIDVTQPEPLSKKDARRAKKGKTTGPSIAKPTDREDNTDLDPDSKPAQGAGKPAATEPESKRSEYGIWIGNLAFSIDKTSLRTFLTGNGIPDSAITRIHMPAPPVQKGAPAPRFKPANKGFAYVDFETAEHLAAGLALSESLLSGRKVLIKDAKSFTGRPEKPASETAAAAAAAAGAKPPSKRVFVGNLAFDVTKETLQEHFSPAGEIEHIHLATFEDTGKCKGFAWVTFAEMAAAAAAVAGFVMKQPDDDGSESSESEDEAEVAKVVDESSDGNSDSDSDNDSDDDDDDSESETTPTTITKPVVKAAPKRKKAKARKWFLNRINGRDLRCEFAEDATTRYNKRYKTQKPEGAAAESGAAGGIDGAAGRVHNKARPRGDADERAEQRRRKHVDARNIRPGAALANAPRASGAIVAGSGTKKKFDD